MDKLYKATPDGYCGDEDNGQTSAWYIFSSMGFYPVTPATDQYVLGSPLFKRVTLTLENGKKVIINASNNSAKNRYVKSLVISGKILYQKLDQSIVVLQKVPCWNLTCRRHQRKIGAPVRWIYRTLFQLTKKNKLAC
jgi:putative alpha-1,2-mannosidase